MDKRQWIIDQHVNTNHHYDNDLPYSFHLNMAQNVYEEYKHLLDDTVDYFTGKREIDRGVDTTETLHIAAKYATIGHDLIEDARVSYNDVCNVLGQAAAEIIYAVTNEKGKSRKERANDKYYEGIRNTKGAVFVKLCDRIANVQYSKLTKSRQYEMYKKENVHFLAQLGWDLNGGSVKNMPVAIQYAPMFNYLVSLFEN